MHFSPGGKGAKRTIQPLQSTNPWRPALRVPMGPMRISNPWRRANRENRHAEPQRDSRQVERHGDKQTNMETDRQTHRHGDRQTDRQAWRQTDRQTWRQTDRQTWIQTDRQTDMETDRQAGMQVDRQTENRRMNRQMGAWTERRRAHLRWTDTGKQAGKQLQAEENNNLLLQISSNNFQATWVFVKICTQSL